MGFVTVDTPAGPELVHTSNIMQPPVMVTGDPESAVAESVAQTLGSEVTEAPGLRTVGDHEPAPEPSPLSLDDVLQRKHKDVSNRKLPVLLHLLSEEALEELEATVDGREPGEEPWRYSLRMRFKRALARVIAEAERGS